MPGIIPRSRPSNPAAFQRIDLNGGAYGILPGRLGPRAVLRQGRLGYLDRDAGQKTTSPGFVTHRTGAFSGAV